MQITPWSNNLGWNVGNGGDNDAEIWKMSHGKWGVRIFDKDGCAYKSLLVNPKKEAGLFGFNQEDAIKLCEKKGNLI